MANIHILRPTNIDNDGGREAGWKSNVGISKKRLRNIGLSMKGRLVEVRWREKKNIIDKDERCWCWQKSDGVGVLGKTNMKEAAG